MGRTKADAYTKAGGKAPRKAGALGGGHNSSSLGDKAGNQLRNSYLPRPIPTWQKPITSFFDKKPQDDSSKEDEMIDVEVKGKASNLNSAAAGSSKPGPTDAAKKGIQDKASNLDYAVAGSSNSASGSAYQGPADVMECEDDDDGKDDNTGDDGKDEDTGDDGKDEDTGDDGKDEDTDDETKKMTPSK